MFVRRILKSFPDDDPTNILEEILNRLYLPWNNKYRIIIFNALSLNNNKYYHYTQFIYAPKFSKCKVPTITKKASKYLDKYTEFYTDLANEILTLSNFLYPVILSLKRNDLIYEIIPEVLKIRLDLDPVIYPISNFDLKILEEAKQQPEYQLIRRRLMLNSMSC